MNKRRLHNSLIVLFLTVSAVSMSAASGYTGAQIMQQVYDRPTPQDQSGELTMILENSRGDQRVRTIEQYIKEYDDSSMKIMFFTAPSDVRGTSFMNYSYDEEGRSDDQWIYLPALKKVKRISSGGSSDYFMGSDFTYDDMGQRIPGSDIHTIVGEEVLDGRKCIMVESVSKDTDYMYSRTVTWVDPESWTGLQKQFYDEDGDLLKQLTVISTEEINGYTMITESVMHTIQKDHRTMMSLDELILDAGLDDSLFTTRTMTRGVR